MLDVFLCCSPADREVAASVAERLETTAEVKVVLDDSEGTVVQKWEGGLASAGILLLLSPSAAPRQAGRTEWGPLLDHLSGNSEPPLASLLVSSCGFPRLLERKHFFSWQDGSPEVLRALQEWAVALHPLPEQRSFAPARLPWFAQREQELVLLWETLVDRPGAAVLVNPQPASGKTSLAQQFARQASAHFRDVLWVACTDRSPAGIAAHLAELIGVPEPGDPSEAFPAMMELAGEHRVLLVLDDASPALAVPNRQARASVLITTRMAQMPAPAGASIVRLASPAPCSFAALEDSADIALWRAMAVCRPSGFPLELAVRIAVLDATDAPAAKARLVQSRLVDPMDDLGGWMRRSPAANLPDAAMLEGERRRHAEALHSLLCEWRNRPEFHVRYFAECLPAFHWAALADWQLACGLARHLFAFLRHHGRTTEGGELLGWWRAAADERGDWQVSDECSWELSWIRGRATYSVGGYAPVDGNQMSLDFGG